MMKVIVHCDESGNSGDNYLESEQPFYVLAGWITPANKLDEASGVVQKTLNNICPQRTELKAGAFLKNELRKNAAVDMFTQLGALGCMPIMVVAEKLYCLTGKIVETFLDPAFNATIGPAFTYDTETKKELANTLMARLPKEVLGRFAETYRHPTSEGFSHSLEEIARAATAYVNPELAKCLEGSIPKIKEIAVSEGSNASSLGKISQSVNLPALMSLFLMVENLGRLGVIEPLKIVHDEQSVFEEDMREVHRIHKDAGDFLVETPNSDIPYSNFRHIPLIEFAVSKDNEMIQASDVLAGVVNHLMKLAVSDETPSAADMKLAASTIPAFFQNELRIAWLIVSSSLQEKVATKYILRMVAGADAVPLHDDRHDIVAGKAEVFPVVGHERKKPASSRERFMWDIPIFGIVGSVSGTLMCVNVGDFELEGKSYSLALPLFTTREKAEVFLGYWKESDLTEPQLIQEFGYREVQKLASMMKHCLQIVRVLVIDPGFDEDAKKFLDLAQAVEGMERMIDKTIRTLRSGLDKVMLQKHDCGGTEVMTILSSSGKYGALTAPGGKLYWGESRDEALQALVNGEELPPPKVDGKV